MSGCSTSMILEVRGSGASGLRIGSGAWGFGASGLKARCWGVACRILGLLSFSAQVVG